MSSRTWIIALGAAVVAIPVFAWVMQSRRSPTACPYGQSFALEFPRPFLQRGRLLDVLRPVPGERLLEIGPGKGYYTLDVARQIAPGGRLDILDLQPEMLDETMRRAQAQGIENIHPTQANAETLPYPGATFDGAFLVATLGEVPDKAAALRELRRVLKPGGRLVVGEGQPDPHMVRLPVLQELAQAAGLHFQERSGGALGFLARFETMEVAVGRPGAGIIPGAGHQVEGNS